MEQFINKLTNHFSKYLALSIFLVFYLVVFWYLFFNKGIYVDGHFYKKSANLTQVCYTASSIGAEYKQIVLEKYIDKSLITIDGEYTVSVFSDGSSEPVVTADSRLADTAADWVSIANQDAEGIRGFGQKPWFAVVIIYVLFFLAKKYNVQIYSFFRRGRAAGENYYRYFDRVFNIFCIVALIYLILPF